MFLVNKFDFSPKHDFIHDILPVFVFFPNILLTVESLLFLTVAIVFQETGILTVPRHI